MKPTHRVTSYGAFGAPSAVDRACLARNCRADAEPGAPVDLCGTHQAEVARFWQESATSAPLTLRRPVTVDRSLGLVYFIRRGDDVKIGWTRNIKERLVGLKGDALLHTEPGTREDERRMHAAFAHYAIGGEWFTFGPDLASFILRLKTGVA